jgi:hypothetical protein
MFGAKVQALNKLQASGLIDALGGNFDGVTTACDGGIFSGSYEGSLNLGP